MAKLTDKEKQAHYRQKVAKEYKHRVDDLTNKNRELANKVISLSNENKELKSENEKLRKKVESLDTINKLVEGKINNLANNGDITVELSRSLNRLFTLL